MLKKTFLMTVGSFIFVIGMVFFPLPLPIGLPIMIFGLVIMFKASNRFKRIVIKLSDKNHYSRSAWQKIKTYRRRKKKPAS